MSAMTRKYAVIISSLPIVQSGLLAIMKEYFPEYEVSPHRDTEELLTAQLCKATLVIVELSCEMSQRKMLCEQYYALMVQHPHIHWIFMVNHAIYPLAVEYLLRPESTLLADAEPIPQVINAIKSSTHESANLSAVLISSGHIRPEEDAHLKTSLTLSERQVLRLLAKGWGVNQIATLLNKSNKTISAQKNSAMRRLSLKGNAEMFAWMNSAQGIRELNLMQSWGESAQCKSLPQKEVVLS